MNDIAVIFDFDGVIADTEPTHLRATQHALDSRGVTLDLEEYERLYLGYSDHGLFDTLARDRSLDWSAGDIDVLVRSKSLAFDTLIAGESLVYPSASRCITRLAAAKIPLAIASGAFANEIELILDGSGLRAHFHSIVGAGDYARGKPSPDPYIEAARRLGIPPSRAVAIEDSQWGLDSARAAGCCTIAVTHTYPRAALTANIIIDSLDDVTLEMIRAATAH